MLYSPTLKAAISLMSSWDAGQWYDRGSAMYSPRLRQMMANIDGLSTTTDTQANMKAGSPPNASWRYVYSAPEFGSIVPNSLYDRAPAIQKNEVFQKLSFPIMNQFHW